MNKFYYLVLPIILFYSGQCLTMSGQGFSQKLEEINETVKDIQEIQSKTDETHDFFSLLEGELDKTEAKAQRLRNLKTTYEQNKETLDLISGCVTIAVLLGVCCLWFYDYFKNKSESKNFKPIKKNFKARVKHD